MTLPDDPRKLQSNAVRVANTFGAPLKRAISFNPEYLMAKARRSCRLTDFGGNDFEEPFRKLAHAMDRNRLHFTGRALAHRELLLCLANRLRIAEYFRRNPGTANVPVPDPVVVTGLLRSGTTFLHKILAQDLRTRTLRAWELLCPVPLDWGEGATPDFRPVLVRRVVRREENWLRSPEGRWIVNSIHPFDADAPEECWPLLQNSFCSSTFSFRGAGYEYARWLSKQDMTESYRYYRKQLQILTANEPAERLAVKFPGHLGALRELISVFPNAKILWLHRDPAAVVPSGCSLVRVHLSLRTNFINSQTMGPMLMDDLLVTLGKSMQARQCHRPDQYMDVYYHDLVANPIGTARRVYEFLGWRPDPDWEESLADFLARDRESRRGMRHEYNAEAFGLTKDNIREAFRNYTERFPALVESY